MNKTELILRWQEAAGVKTARNFSLSQLEVAYDSLIEVIGIELSAGGEITLLGIGKLKVKDVPARKGRNPKTGEEIPIPARRKAIFSASSVLKTKLNAV